jgi:hypothetical protein
VAQETPVLFADALMSVRLTHGVIRVTFGSLDDENKLQPRVTLVVPLERFNGIVGHLSNAARGLIAKAREVQAKTVSQPENPKKRNELLH